MVLNWIKNVSQFNEDFIKHYNEESNEGYFLEVDVQNFENVHKAHNHLPFLPEAEKVEKHVANLDDKNECIIPQKKLKTTIKSWISLGKSE